MADCSTVIYNPDLDNSPDAVQEARVGYAFENADLNSDTIFPGWGQMVTADELRYIDLMGTKLVSPADAQTVDDKMLRYYVLQAITYVERRLDFDIFPRWIRYVNEDREREGMPIPDGQSGGWIDPESRLIRESGYPLKIQNRRYWNTFETYRKPVRRNDNLRIDFLTPERQIALELPKRWIRLLGDGFYGQIQIVPDGGSSGEGFLDHNMMVSHSHHALTNDLPGTIGVDYDTGYARAGLVPPELRELIRKHAAWNLYANFGTAKSPGIASANVGLNSISEGYTTTATSTSGIFGSEMVKVEAWLKIWYKENANKFRDCMVGPW